MMGLPSGQVSIEDYTGRWPDVFEEERDRLIAALGPLVLAVEHVGSTSVPGLCAKPVIDIAVGVTDLLTGKECVAPLSALGYEYKGEAGIPGRHFFAKGNPENRTHYVHVEPRNGVLWRNHILFRDYLRCHPDEAATYGQLKKALAENYSADRDAYAQGKDDYIESVIRTASQEYEMDESGRSRRSNEKHSDSVRSRIRSE